MTQKEVSVAKLARLLELTNFTEQVNLKHKKVCLAYHTLFLHLQQLKVNSIRLLFLQIPYLPAKSAL